MRVALKSVNSLFSFYVWDIARALGKQLLSDFNFCFIQLHILSKPQRATGTTRCLHDRKYEESEILM